MTNSGTAPRPVARWPMGDCLTCGRRVNVDTGEGHGPRCANSGTAQGPVTAAELREALRWRHPRRHTVAPWADEAGGTCVHTTSGSTAEPPRQGPRMCDLCRGAIDRWNEGERLIAASSTTSETAGLDPDWTALMAEAAAFEAWFGPTRMAVNAWVGVDTTSGELYGGWSVEGDPLADDWDESEMTTASGATPADVIADLIDIARKYRERRDAERAEWAADDAEYERLRAEQPKAEG